MDIRIAQQHAWENKQRKGFNTTDIPLELCLLQGEIAEFFQAWRRRQANIGEELADIAIYLLGLAEMVNVDLDTEINQKMSKNSARTYVRRNGVLTKVEESTD